MPVPQQFGRGDRMGRGPYEKSGIIEDTGLPPGKPVEERFEILFPTEDFVGDNGRTQRRTLTNEMDVTVQLWYLPYGTMATDPFLWKEFTKTVTISDKGN